jgi:hypothetical protein
MNKVALTLFNAVLLRMLLIHCLPLIGTGDTLNTLIEVVLNWRAAFGLLALCRINVSNARKIYISITTKCVD